MNKIELKPCPFCGGYADLVLHTFRTLGREGDSYGVKCRECWCQTPQFFISPEVAAEVWNRRVHHDD